MRKNNEYKKLYDLLPLETPLSLLIEPTNICNFQCVFCPTGNTDLLNLVNRPKGMMNLSLFKKIINDLCEFKQKVKKIYLYKDGEQFLNPDLFEMIKYVKSKNVAESVETTSNGSLIDHKKSIELIESDLDAIRFSI